MVMDSAMWACGWKANELFKAMNLLLQKTIETDATAYRIAMGIKKCLDKEKESERLQFESINKARLLIIDIFVLRVQAEGMKDYEDRCGFLARCESAFGDAWDLDKYAQVCQSYNKNSMNMRSGFKSKNFYINVAKKIKKRTNKENDDGEANADAQGQGGDQDEVFIGSREEIMLGEPMYVVQESFSLFSGGSPYICSQTPPTTKQY